MINGNKEYMMLLEHYNNIINSPYWKKSKKIRKFLDKFRHVENHTPRQGTADAFESLLNDYDKLNDSIFWQITRFQRRKDSKNNNTIIKDDKYSLWIKKHELNEEIAALEFNPLISVIVPVHNTREKFLKECIESVLNQSYDNYELVLVDDRSDKPEVINLLKSYSTNKKVKTIKNQNNVGGISFATNIGLSIATGDYFCFLDHDDTLSKNALYEIAKTINKNLDVEIIYSDEDKIDEEGSNRYAPVFKPDWSPDRLLNDNYICHLVCYKKELVTKTGFFDCALDGSQDYDYILRASELTTSDKIEHISKVLYHWRMSSGSTALNVSEKPYVIEATKKTKLKTIERRKYNAHLDSNNNIFFESSPNNKVSIIIPSKDNFEILKRAIDSIINNHFDFNYQIIVVDNGSNDINKNIISDYLNSLDIKYIYQKMNFNYSRICNIGAKESDGNILLFLNDDIEILNGDSLNRMIGFAELEHIGAVGLKLYYPNSTLIQHCGVSNIFPGPSHSLQKHDDMKGYNNNFNRIINDVIAVTGACMMVKRNTFFEIGCFDEKFQNNFNDTELCFRLYEKGLFNVVVNDQFMYHYESFSRKEQEMKDVLFECRELYNKHPNMFLYDPFYNENFSFGNCDFII